MHGSTASTEELTSKLSENESMTQDIYMPKIGETIDASTARDMYRCKISDALFPTLSFIKKGDYEIAYIHGITQIAMGESSENMEVDRDVPSILSTL